MEGREVHNQIEVTNEQLEEGIKRDFGFEVLITNKVTEGFSNQVYSAKLGDKEVFIRMTKDERVFPVEVEGYRLFALHDLPAPKILAFQPKSISLGIPTMVMEKAVGENITSVIAKHPEKKDHFHKKAGEVLKKIHSIKIEGFGGLFMEDGKLKTMSKSWAEHLSQPDNKKRFDYLLEHSLVTQKEYEAIVANHQFLISVPLGQASLLHNDFSGTHIFTDGSEITGIIDLGGVFAGDPKYDIARSFLYMDEDERKAFAEGYGMDVSDELVLKYLLLITAKITAWRHKEKLIEGFTVGYLSSQKMIQDIVRKLSSQLGSYIVNQNQQKINIAKYEKVDNNT